MNIAKDRILIFGAGVVGSIYALRLAQYGVDVTVLARGERLKDLQHHGLRYNDSGTIKHISIPTIEQLADDDIYDFILVPVRYDQAESALAVLKNNQSQTIVTLTNTVGYDAWLDLVGDRLLPGFPGAGGDLKNGVLYAQFSTEKHQGTIFGEIDGTQTERVTQLAQLFKLVDLHYDIQSNIQAFHISHTAIAIANKHFYTKDGIVDIDTARNEQTLLQIATAIKQNLRLVEQAHIPIIPAETKILTEWSDSQIISLYQQMLNDAFIMDAILGDHAVNQKAETLLLQEAFNQTLARQVY
ncbi:2-dehydropantoate 2-reductase N-terminal domain-containing protein [Paenibacillus sp. PK4536]|uniref:2-dehydropantoate 2-reductase n=1 Tax=Paenibacillus nuruki TaxID=1886670 RepID=A0A1E3LA11_9BACL|nr:MULTISPECIES: 2-dehydropantoate 2-reductase N-terminal domain-containing protein [Paenibacillus]ODP30431.1 2-dehydropantoate 2-reductase [Paenibacillus nuruki]TKJ87023.1 ketopantoate reductase family protein [Paenibacillus sp. CFBP13512]WIM39609.1 2-dehydropantoate 2-reductase N-terminal domain-containing protein [Paenibacillus sp. PK4536]CAJ1313163.1 2-dehydropantoate 2-reductase [Paenibacillus nuruki]